jgi:hypothetical protein
LQVGWGGGLPPQGWFAQRSLLENLRMLRS